MFRFAICQSKVANISIQLMDFAQKQERMENYDYNVKSCLHNEIESKCCINNEFRKDHSDVGQMINFVCTQIKFNDYLKQSKMKVNVLQVIINALYYRFVKEITSNKSPLMKSIFKSLVKKSHHSSYYQ